MKFTTGSPKPRFAKAVPVMVKLAGGLARSTTLGLIALTPGPGRVSVRVSSRAPVRLEVLFPAFAYTVGRTPPTVMLLEHGTGIKELPVRALERTGASLEE